MSRANFSANAVYNSYLSPRHTPRAFFYDSTHLYLEATYPALLNCCPVALSRSLEELFRDVRTQNSRLHSRLRQPSRNA